MTRGKGISRWGAHAPSRVSARAIAGRSRESEPHCASPPSQTELFRGGAEQSTRGACAPHAFTIIEVMLAIGIFSMILLSIYSVWTGILKASRAGIAAGAEAQ